jgi:sugar transferase (PEP-CTERM/EpsH1 system associated)
MGTKIMHIVNSLNVGGLENGVVNLVNCLNHNKFIHVICCLREVGPMAERLHRKDTEIICMGKDSTDYFMPIKLMHLISRIRPQVVHTRNWGTIDGIIAAKLARVKYVVHGEHGREFTDLYGSNYRRNLARWVLGRWVNSFVAVSDEIKSWLLNQVGIPGDKVVTIINGVDTKKFFPSTNKGKVKQELGIDPHTFIVGTVGRLDKVKNYQMLLNALLSQTRYKNPYKLMLIGDGPERADLEAFVTTHRLSNVEFLGEKQNVQDYLQIFDLFVLTSMVEGISNTILEAMATGTPVIATRVGGNPEIVEDNMTGSLIPSGNHALLSEMITKYMNDRSLCEKHGQAARSRCEKLFSLNVMVEKYDRLYSNFL